MPIAILAYTPNMLYNYLKPVTRTRRILHAVAFWAHVFTDTIIMGLCLLMLVIFLNEIGVL
jgi:hypothetical protein